MIRAAKTSRYRLAGGLVTIYVVWGTTFLGIRVGVQTIPPFLMSGARFMAAGVLILAWVAFQGGMRPGWPNWRHWLSASLAGTGVVAIGNGATSWSEQYLASGSAAIFIATVPLWMAVLAWIFQKEPLRPVVAIGLVIGLGGLAILVGPSAFHDDYLVAKLACLFAAAGWAASTVYSRSAPFPDNPFLVAGMQMLAGGAVVFLFSLVSGDAERFNPAAVSIQSAVAFGYLVLVGSVIGFGIFMWLIKVAPLTLVGTYAYVNPVVAVVLGHFILGERVSVQAIVGGGIIIAGVALIVVSQSRQHHEATAIRAGSLG